ncbi:GDSL-type esterase/lipase family protein [Xenophilus arseniciresistens]|uniref:GDSL-type esterase/lipase family protein n=1 Tax=Xenophilus arseniciresistens TaxID=1283306 RepID=A0AAE3N6H6_9BURK|nr:GDSL-type esterase/lipase family protein [Xenophilus arseniciresistens]MDA7416805.1 GDSL-type esterase/lipase family protein [Xenophilus arseniciresistens]
MQRRPLLHALALGPALALLAACGRKSKAAALPAGAAVLALGDSLTAGYGAAPGQGWPEQLAGLTGWQVVNEGVNGDTSEGALQRLAPLLQAQRFDAILIGIGGNDMLRGVDAAQTERNLRAIVDAARAQSTHVALLATPAPDALRAAAGLLGDAPFYASVAQQTQALLLPGIYAKVLSDRALRSDPIHANAAGYARIAQALAEALKDAGWR